MGLMNKLINNLPFEAHIPGYRFCGPGTKLRKRLARGDVGVNPLDEACKKHDIQYSINKDNLEKRHEADRELAESAWKRVLADDSSLGEKAAAWAVTNVMKAKTKLGMGRKKCKGAGRKKTVKTKKQGGFLPLIPAVLAGLSAVGALSSGAAGIAKAVNTSRSQAKELQELKRHNQTMEAIASGKGLMLKPYKAGAGKRRSTKKKN